MKKVAVIWSSPNRDGLTALADAGRTYAETLETGFDMYY